MDQENTAFVCDTRTHTHNGTQLSHKKDGIMSFAATWRDLEITMPSEVSQTEKTNIIRYHSCGIYL